MHSSKKATLTTVLKIFIFWLLFLVKKLWFSLENCNEDKENIYKYYPKNFWIVPDD